MVMPERMRLGIEGEKDVRFRIKEQIGFVNRKSLKQIIINMQL
jgi:hypothetical protein